jgi:membrane protein DedA with SNARE-associated domain
MGDGIALVLLSAVLGAILGSTIGFWIGDRYGRDAKLLQVLRCQVR